MSILMNGESCKTCSCAYFTDKDRMKLICMRHNTHPRMHDHCGGYEEDRHERPVITPDLIRVINLLRGVS